MNENVERLARQIHKIYCTEYNRQEGKPYWTEGDYSKLKEETKEYDRVLARYILENYALRVKEKTVCISGGFDPIHFGHIRLIEESSKLGKLTVIINDDKFLVKKKGFVFMPLRERVVILKAIRGVETVFIAPDTDGTVCKALRQLRPNIFSNGGDRTVTNVPEVEVCRELGIEMRFNVGGSKVQSSSDLVNKWK